MTLSGSGETEDVVGFSVDPKGTNPYPLPSDSTVIYQTTQNVDEDVVVVVPIRPGSDKVVVHPLF